MSQVRDRNQGSKEALTPLRAQTDAAFILATHFCCLFVVLLLTPLGLAQTDAQIKICSKISLDTHWQTCAVTLASRTILILKFCIKSYNSRSWNHKDTKKGKSSWAVPALRQQRIFSCNALSNTSPSLGLKTRVHLKTPDPAAQQRPWCHYDLVVSVCTKCADFNSFGVISVHYRAQLPPVFSAKSQNCSCQVFASLFLYPSRWC